MNNPANNADQPFTPTRPDSATLAGPSLPVEDGLGELGLLGETAAEHKPGGTALVEAQDTVVGFNLNVPVAPGLMWRDLGTTHRYPTIRHGIPAVLDGYVHFRRRHPLTDRRTS